MIKAAPRDTGEPLNIYILSQDDFPVKRNHPQNNHFSPFHNFVHNILGTMRSCKKPKGMVLYSQKR